MAEANEQKKNDKPFTAAIKAASVPDGNYLGDREVVESLLRFYIATLIDNLDGVSNTKQIINEMRIVAKEVANILLGKEGRKYIPVRKWNKFNGIDVFCAKWLNIQEKDPSERMEHAFIIMFNEVADLADFASTPGVLEEQWKPGFDEIVTKYTDLFTGLDPVTKAVVS